jgi:hypothetical protein
MRLRVSWTVGVLNFGLVVAIALSAAQPARSADAGEGLTTPPGSTVHATDDPTFQAQTSAAAAQGQVDEAKRHTPEEVAARQESRSAYEDLSAGQAQAVALDFFGELMLEPSWPTYEPPPGQQIDHYLGPDAVLLEPDQEAQGSGVDGEAGAGAVVQSMTPMRAKTESGARRPTDSELVADGDHLEPANAVVEPELPRDLADGIELPDIDLTVAPDHAVQADTVDVVGQDKAFYASIATDTDFIASPTERGVETFWQLRSERSPEQLSLNLDLPTDAELRRSFHGLAVDVVRGGETVATVRPPLAFDADHVSVPVDMRVEGESVLVSIDHRSQDWKYPILVDPAVDQVDVWTMGTPCPSAGPQYPGWRWESAWGAWPASNPYLQPGCDSTWGLVNFTPSGDWRYAGWWSQWVWAPPANSYIQAAEFYGTELSFSYPDWPCRYLGIYSTRSQYWQTGDSYCWEYPAATETYSVGTAGEDDNAAIHTFYFNDTNSYGDNPAWQWQTAWTALRGAKFTVSDRHAPTASAGTPSAPYAGETTWVDDSQATYHLPISATDQGLGIAKFYLSSPAGQQTLGTGCSGSDLWSNPCPLAPPNRTADYQMPEGKHRVSVQSEDLVGNQSAVAYGPWQRVDRSAPVVGVPTGSLYANRNDIVQQLSYKLNPFISDGSRTSADAMQSGVQRVDYYVDNETTPRYSFSQPCSNVDGSCAFNPTETPGAVWTTRPADSTNDFDGEFSEGMHQVRVIATDMVGHRSPANSQVFTINVRSDDREPDVVISSGPVGLDGTYQLTVNAQDGQAIGSAAGTAQAGVTHLEVYADGQLLDEVSQACPSGGCSIARTYRMSALQSPTLSEFYAFADDGAKNGAVQPYGSKRSRFTYFGFNDAPATLAQHLSLVTNGEANILRFPMDWCVAATDNSQPEQEVPASLWRMEIFDPVFDAVGIWNDGHPTDPIYVLPTAVNAPQWASEDPDAQACDDDVASPPEASYEDDYGTFVRKIAEKWGAQRFGLIGIEAWNEPNLRPFWGVPVKQANGTVISPPRPFTPDPGRFARLVKSANAAIEAWSALPANVTLRGTLPPIQVLAGGLSPPSDPAPPGLENAPAYLDAVLDPTKTDHLTFGPGAGSVDGLAVHLYATSKQNERGASRDLRGDYNALVSVLESRGAASTPLWITEIGFPSEPGGDLDLTAKAASPVRQCRRLTDAFLRFANRSPKPRSFIVHRLLDPPASQEQNRFGLVRDDPAHPGQVLTKPAYRELKKLAAPGASQQPVSCAEQA